MSYKLTTLSVHPCLSLPLSNLNHEPLDSFNPSSITANGILPQPHGKTAIVSGLNCITRIFSLLGEILVRIRVDKRSPPQGPFAEARLEEVRSLHIRILNALAHSPAPLRLKSIAPCASGIVGMGPIGGAGGVSNCEWPGGAGFRQATFAEVRELFDNPKASRTNASNPFLVMQANLYVTQVRSVRTLTSLALTGPNSLQQLVRFVIEQYRDELMLSIGATTAEELEISSQEDREAVASDLLNVLHRCVRSSLPQMHLLRADQFLRTASPFSPLLRTALPLCIRSASSPRLFWTPSEGRKRPLHRLPALTRTYGTSSQFSLRLKGVTY